jgi:hypothetical protein
MRKENPKFRWHVTAKERRRVKELTLQRLTQADIARKLGLTAPTVSRIQKLLGLPTRIPTPATPESKIVEMFQAGCGGYEISRMLRCPANRVWAVRKKYKIPMPANGSGCHEPKGNIPGFLADLEKRAGYIKVLARKHGVGFVTARRLAHIHLACLEFRRGVGLPLQSNFPMREFDVRFTQPDDAIGLVQRILALCFHGHLPPIDDSVFVAAMMAGFSHMPHFADAPPEVIADFQNKLTVAVGTLRECHTMSGVVN